MARRRRPVREDDGDVPPRMTWLAPPEVRPGGGVGGFAEVRALREVVDEEVATVSQCRTT